MTTTRKLTEIERQLVKAPHSCELVGILNPQIWLANHAHLTGPAFYDTAHGPIFSPLTKFGSYWSVNVNLLPSFTHPSTVSQRRFISVHFKMARKVTVKAETHEATRRHDRLLQQIASCDMWKSLSLRSVARIQTGLNSCDVSQRQNKRKQPCRTVCTHLRQVAATRFKSTNEEASISFQRC